MEAEKHKGKRLVSYFRRRRNWSSSISTVPDYRLDDQGSILGRASVSRPALRPTQPPIQRVPEVLSRR
jgi:hypothetical protein